MKTSINVAALSFFMLLAVPAAESLGGSWRVIAPAPRPYQDIVTLIVTGNFTRPRLLADVVQGENRQPYILFPASEGEGIYFIPAEGDALELREDQVTRFIRFLNPRRILVLGDENYVPREYLNLIDTTQSVMLVYNQSWLKTALAVGDVLNLPNLADDYEKLARELEVGLRYKPDRSYLSMGEPSGRSPGLVPVTNGGQIAEPMVTDESRFDSEYDDFAPIHLPDPAPDTFDTGLDTDLGTTMQPLPAASPTIAEPEDFDVLLIEP